MCDIMPYVKPANGGDSNNANLSRYAGDYGEPTFRVHGVVFAISGIPRRVSRLFGCIGLFSRFSESVSRRTRKRDMRAAFEWV